MVYFDTDNVWHYENILLSYLIKFLFSTAPANSYDLRSPACLGVSTAMVAENVVVVFLFRCLMKSMEFGFCIQLEDLQITCFLPHLHMEGASNFSFPTEPYRSFLQ